MNKVPDMEPDILWNFIKGFRESSDSYNFIGQCNPNTGKFRIERNSLEELWKLYCDALQKGEKFLGGLSEKPSEFLPLIVDVDLELKYDDKINLSERLYSRDEAKVIIKVYQKVLTEVIKDCDFQNLACFLLEKPKPYVTGERVKGGFHLHFPRIWIRNCDHDLHIYPRVVQKLNTEYPKLFKKLSIINTGDVIDKKVCSKHWLVYGSGKNEIAGSYRFTEVINAMGKNTSIVDAMEGFPILNTSEEEIKLDETNSEYYLPRILSIHPANKPIIYLKQNLDCLVKLDIGVASEKTVQIEKISVSEAIIMAGELLALISSTRADNYDSWFEMLCVLYCIGDGCQEALDLTIEFSKRTNKNNFDLAYCSYQWDKLVNTGKYTLATLKHYARLDSPEEYRKWQLKRASSRVLTSLNGGHNDLAKMLYDLHSNEYIFTCSDNEKPLWYQFKDNKWKLNKKGFSLRSKISDELSGYFIKEADNYKCSPLDDGSDNKKMGERIKKILGNLKAAPFKTNVMKECEEEFNNPDFLQKLDSNINLIGFLNGVFDIESMTFRPGKPEDYISLSTEYEYKEFTDDDPLVLEVKDFLIKVFPDPLLRRYFLEYSAQLLKGGNFRKIFLNHTGEGDNGKSVTVDLIGLTLGRYSIKFPTSLITGKRTQSSGATPEMARIQGVRVGWLQEPSKNDAVNSGVLKELTGNDSVYIRGLFQSGGDVKPMFKLNLICNYLIKMEADDTALWNRVKVLPYESWFPKGQDIVKVPKTFEEQLAKKIFYRDDNFSEKLPHMRQPFMWMLIQVLKEVVVKGCSPEPDKVTEATASYRRRNDIFLKYINEHIKEDSKSSISINETYGAFQQWCRESFSKMKDIPDKDDLVTDLSKRWGSPVDNRWVGFRIRSVDDDVRESKALILSRADLASVDEEDDENEEKEHVRLIK